MTDEALGKFLREPPSEAEADIFDAIMRGDVVVNGEEMTIPLRWRSDDGRHGIIAAHLDMPLSQVLALIPVPPPEERHVWKVPHLREVLVFLRTPQ